MNLLTNPNSNRMNSPLTVISHRRTQMMRLLIVINQPINQMSNLLRRGISQNSKQKTRPLTAINRPSKQKNSPLTVISRPNKRKNSLARATKRRRKQKNNPPTGISRRRPEARTTRWRLPEETRLAAGAGEQVSADQARTARPEGRHTALH